MHAYYHGCTSASSLGHRWHEGVLSQHGTPRWDKVPYKSGQPNPPGFPWPHADGALHHSRTQGEAWLHHKDGWTALAFEDRSADRRPNSNSVFAFDADMSFDQAVREAAFRFPWVWERFDFEVFQHGG